MTRIAGSKVPQKATLPVLRGSSRNGARTAISVKPGKDISPAASAIQVWKGIIGTEDVAEAETRQSSTRETGIRWPGSSGSSNGMIINRIIIGNTAKEKICVSLVNASTPCCAAKALINKTITLMIAGGVLGSNSAETKAVNTFVTAGTKATMATAMNRAAKRPAGMPTIAVE